MAIQHTPYIGQVGLSLNPFIYGSTRYSKLSPVAINVLKHLPKGEGEFDAVITDSRSGEIQGFKVRLLLKLNGTKVEITPKTEQLAQQNQVFRQFFKAEAEHLCSHLTSAYESYLTGDYESQTKSLTLAEIPNTNPDTKEKFSTTPILELKAKKLSPKLLSKEAERIESYMRERAFKQLIITVEVPNKGQHRFNISQKEGVYYSSYQQPDSRTKDTAILEQKAQAIADKLNNQTSKPEAKRKRPKIELVPDSFQTSGKVNVNGIPLPLHFVGGNEGIGERFGEALKPSPTAFSTASRDSSSDSDSIDSASQFHDETTTDSEVNVEDSVSKTAQEIETEKSLGAQADLLPIQVTAGVSKKSENHVKAVLHVKKVSEVTFEAKYPIFVFDMDEVLLSIKDESLPLQDGYRHNKVLVNGQSANDILSTITALRQKYPDCKVIVLSNDADENIASRLSSVGINPGWFDDIHGRVASEGFGVKDWKFPVTEQIAADCLGNGQMKNKGDRLLAYLHQKPKFECDCICMVDDDINNLDAVYSAAEYRHIPCHTFHFLGAINKRHLQLAQRDRYTDMKAYINAAQNRRFKQERSEYFQALGQADPFLSN
ncbi:MAG: hypothetical protein ACPGUD_05900 [Parashewanella sp.]